MKLSEITEEHKKKILNYVTPLKPKIGKGLGKLSFKDVARRFSISDIVLRNIIDENKPKLVKWKCPYCKCKFELKESVTYGMKTCGNSKCVKDNTQRINKTFGWNYM